MIPIWLKVTFGIALVFLVLGLPRRAQRALLRLRPDPAAAGETAAKPPTNASSGASDLAPVLEAIRAKNKPPCLAAVVLVGDRVLAQGVTGVRTAGTTERATLEDRFHLGSDTKEMTATLLALLIEEGKFKWTTKVSEVFRDSVTAWTRRGSR